MKKMSSSIDTEEITKQQITKFMVLLQSALRKSGLKKKPVQVVMKQQGKALVREWLATVQRHVDEMSNFIHRIAKVVRSRSPLQVVDATKRAKYISEDVLATMPKGKGNKKKVVFFKENKFISPEDLVRKFKDLRLEPDPYALAAVNEADPEFADTYPNCTQWKDGEGNWCYIAFGRYGGERYVDVDRNDHDWHDDWWFGGVPQD